MEQRKTFLAATLLAASALSAPSFASGNVGAPAAIGGTGATANVDAGAVVVAEDASGGTRIDTQATASTGGRADVRSVMSAIGSNWESSSTIKRATKVKAVDVIDVSDMAGADGNLGSAISKYQANIEELQAALQSNAALNSALEAKQVDVTQIVAASMDIGGTLTVYVK
jgi:predicted ATP-dependent Lon-type protease